MKLSDDDDDYENDDFFDDDYDDDDYDDRSSKKSGILSKFNRAKDSGRDRDDDYDDYDDYDDILARIMGAIRRFPPQTRRIFTECILHHKSYKEVGELLNISPLTVKTVMARAFKALREQREFFIPAILLLLAGL